MKLPANCSLIKQTEQGNICGGCSIVSDSLYAAAKFIFPEKKVAGESRGGYYPTFILVPEEIFLDYAALRVSNFLFKAASWLDENGL